MDSSTDRSRDQLPPWEIRQLTAVPFRGTDGYLARMPDRQAFTTTSPETPSSAASGNGWTVTAPWQQRHGIAPNPGSAPYSPYANTAQSPQSATEPSLLAARSPLSRLDNIDGVCKAASTKPSMEQQLTKALPGTMSSRGEGPQERSTARSSRKSKKSDNHHDKENAFGIKTRFKSAVKDFFHRSPVDESNFEKIQGRHWSEDDY